MPEFRYAKGRILESLAFITQEMNEFDAEYKSRSWQEYKVDTKLQKLIDRTIENILTAVVEVSGIILTEKNISADNYSDVMQKIGDCFGFGKDETELLAKFAVHRNRLAHRYLNFRWQVVKFYVINENLLKKLLSAINAYETGKQSDAEEK